MPMGVAALGNMTALSKRNDSPGDARRGRSTPRATGSSSARAPGVVVVESLAHALRARRDADRRGPRRRADRRRVPHQRPRPDRSRPGPGDDAGPAQRRASPRTRSTTSSPTAPRPRSTTSTETRAIKAAYGDARLQGRDQLAEVDDRPPRRRRRDRLGARRDRGDPRPGHPADGQPAHARPGMRPRLRPARRPPGAGRDGRRSTASGSAARTRSPSSARSSTSRDSSRLAQRSGAALEASIAATWAAESATGCAVA